MLLALWIVNCTNKYRKTNDNLIEQGIQFLICFCVSPSTCYTLYYLIISYRTGCIFKSGRIQQLLHLMRILCSRLGRERKSSEGNKNAATIYFYNCQIACAIVFCACCLLLNAFLTLRRGYHVFASSLLLLTGK